MSPQDIEALFTRSTGAYHFARWGRPIAPIAFGVEDESLGVIKGAVEAMCTLAGHSTAETDPELGANLMFFFVRDWQELVAVPNLDQLIPNLGEVVKRLEAAQANQYRAFRFDTQGGIQAAFVLLRMDEVLQTMAAEDLALTQVAQVMLLWGEGAFADQSPLAVASETTVLRPEIGDIIRAGYDAVMPVADQDPSHALRLFARLPAAE
ncbi:MAG: hypothetical protein JXR13_08545 [Thalassovita sp.]